MSAPTDVEQLDLLLIDGDNLLHVVRGGRDDGAVAWLLPRLSAWRPPHLRIVVGLDGHAAPGEASRTRVARGIEFHHSGSRSADDMLVELLSARPYADRARTALVTRDRGLRARARQAGGVTHTVDWLTRRVLGHGPSGAGTRTVGIGQGKPPRGRAGSDRAPDDEERDPWQPGRGATRKRGNPRRSPRRSPKDARRR